MHNKGKRITCTSMEKTNSRQFIIEINIIIAITVVHFPNELNQKRSQYPNCILQLQTSRVQSQSQSHPCFSNHLLKFSPTKPTAFSDLSQSKLLKFSTKSPKFRSFSLSLSLCVCVCVLLQFILYQNALILSKQTLIS